MQSLTSDSRLQRIETESAVVNLKTQDMTSETQVKIKGKNFSSTGLKLVGNLRQQVATLKEQVKHIMKLVSNKILFSCNDGISIKFSFCIER